MKETRRLDVLAIIGGVLAVVILTWLGSLLYAFHATNGFDDYWARDECIRIARLPEEKADLDAMLPPPGLSMRPDIAKLEQAGHRYPDNLRLNLHLSIFAKEPLASQTLNHLAELDPDNSLAVYMVAEKAEAAGSWDRALELIRQANRLPKFDLYDYPYEMAHRDYAIESKLEHVNSNASNKVFSILRKLAKESKARAIALHEQGRDDEALSLLADVRQMGWRLIKRDEADAMGALVGSSIIRTCNTAGSRIATDMGNERELARIKAEAERLLYIRAGTRFFTDSWYDHLMSRVMKCLVLGMAMFWALAVTSMGTLIEVIGLIVTRRKSRNMAASVLHNQAIQRTFSCRRLLLAYGAALVVSSLSALLVFAARQEMDWSLCVVFFFGFITPVGVIMLVHTRLSREYKRTYRQLAEEAGAEPLPKLKLMSLPDKRELTRQSAGLWGLALMTLATWALLVSIGLRVHFGMYPGQLNQAMGGMPQAEMKYVKDLVAGKVKVPQKYIDEVKSEEVRSAKRPGGPK